MESKTGKIDLLTGQIDNIKQENEELKSKIELLTSENKFSIEIVNDLELYSRKDNFIINGILRTPN